MAVKGWLEKPEFFRWIHFWGDIESVLKFEVFSFLVDFVGGESVS